MIDTRPAVLVTGGAKRLGAAIARAFGAADWHVVLHYGSSRAEAEALASDLPSAETMQCDLADGSAAVAMIAELADRLPDWRALVNCAAIFEPDDVTGLDPATNARSMQINATTPARMAQAYLAKARAKSGRRVVQLTDQKIANPNPDFFSYTMSKHALASTVPMLAMGAATMADRVYALAPGAILASHDQREEETEVSHRMNLLHRQTRPEEVAQAALFLAQGHLASGQMLYCDSGQHLLSQPRDVIYLAREEHRT
ncbi:SDR family oxidoreductase [Qipengyuania qiaonensis]|uniref:SDR family oxidoreductase n=1 Tax=Qipengyuania qiaonensis TaxID=2867240 RepID=A0ABS7J0M7_9SPHN|nr:SDR family oxidoreductase [Qipengyuania qiaonensis]MBX7480909.1 SDR family oxidoreductase [Qipengyuania qiaonensis]